MLRWTRRAATTIGDVTGATASTAIAVTVAIIIGTDILGTTMALATCRGTAVLLARHRLELPATKRHYNSIEVDSS